MQRYQPTSHARVFAFAYHRALTLQSAKDGDKEKQKEQLFSHWDMLHVHAECERRNLNWTVWRITKCNSEFELTPTYPCRLVVPQSVSDSEIAKSASVREAGRFVAMTWSSSGGQFIARAARLKAGSAGSIDDSTIIHKYATIAAMSQVDEAVEFGAGCILETVTGGGKVHCRALPATSLSSPYRTEQNIHLLVVDIVSRGEGPNLPNVPWNNVAHISAELESATAIRDAYKRLAKACSSGPNEERFWQAVDQSRWFDILHSFLFHASEIAYSVSRGCSILVTGATAIDRVCLLTSLAQVLIEPYYRTIKGLAVLIEKDWLSFGHPFGLRCGYIHSEGSAQETSPVFILFLDALYQLICQAPCAFEYNEPLLSALGGHLFDGMCLLVDGEPLCFLADRCWCRSVRKLHP